MIWIIDQTVDPRILFEFSCDSSQLGILGARLEKHCAQHVIMKRVMSYLQNQFIVDDVSKIIKESIEHTIGGNAYQHDKVNNWTGLVVENCLGVLTKQQKPYKYIGE